MPLIYWRCVASSALCKHIGALVFGIRRPTQSPRWYGCIVNQSSIMCCVGSAENAIAARRAHVVLGLLICDLHLIDFYLWKLRVRDARVKREKRLIWVGRSLIGGRTRGKRGISITHALHFIIIQMVRSLLLMHLVRFFVYAIEMRFVDFQQIYHLAYLICGQIKC